MPIHTDGPPVTALDWQAPKSTNAPAVATDIPSPAAQGRSAAPEVASVVSPIAPAKSLTNHGIYCNRHQMAFRRHGHPLQTGIEVSELASFVRAVRRVIKRNKDRVNWLAIYQAVGTMVGICKALEAEVRTGRHMSVETRKPPTSLRRLHRT